MVCWSAGGRTLEIYRLSPSVGSHRVRPWSTGGGSCRIAEGGALFCRVGLSGGVIQLAGLDGALQARSIRGHLRHSCRIAEGGTLIRGALEGKLEVRSRGGFGRVGAAVATGRCGRDRARILGSSLYLTRALGLRRGLGLQDGSSRVYVGQAADRVREILQARPGGRLYSRSGLLNSP